jgi:hypothetical protein
VTVQAKEGTPKAVLKPADDELAVVRIVRIAAVKSPDVGRPPGDTGKSHVQTGRKLGRQRLERRSDVTRPNGRAVALAARPGRAAERENLFRTGVAHTFVHAACVIERIPVDGRRARAGMETKVLGLPWIDLGLAGVEPEDIDAELVVVLAQFPPQVRAGLRIRRVVERDRRRDG